MSTPIWALSDGRAGNRRQAEALAEALRLPWRSVEIALRAPWSWLAPHLTSGAQWALPAALRELLAREPPRVAIGCGRRAALVSAWLKRVHGVCAIQILDPRRDPRHWDLVIVPAHDHLVGPNLHTTLGALNPIDDAALQLAARAHAELAALPRPRTALLIGASNRAQRIDLTYLEALAVRIAAGLEHEGGSLMITTSRRSPPEFASWLMQRFAHVPVRIHSAHSKAPNPYLGFLAHADRIVVTPDSVNMLSEACATGKPVYTFAPTSVRGKLAELHRALIDSGRLRPLGERSESWRYQPLRDTETAAAAVWKLLRTRGITPMS